MSYNSVFLEEMEVLQSIYEDELIISESNHSCAEIKITIHPNTADDEDGKYVCLTLHFRFTFSSKSTHCYPNKEPSIFIKNPRGLSDSHLASIDENLKSLAASMTGEQMLFSLIEYAKESLTDNNHPSCNCPICLEKFEEGGNFFRTGCYHYFHTRCIKGYIEIAENMTCPVCRLEFQIDESILKSEEVHKEIVAKDDFVPDETFLKWRRECDVMYEKQRKKGGIIDPEFEKNKYLITLIDTPPMENDILTMSLYQDDIADTTEISNIGLKNKRLDSPIMRSNLPNPKPDRNNSPELRSYRTNSPKPKHDKTSSPIPSNDGSGADSPLLKLKNIHIHEEKTENLSSGESSNDHGLTTGDEIPREKKSYQSCYPNKDYYSKHDPATKDYNRKQPHRNERNKGPSKTYNNEIVYNDKYTKGANNIREDSGDYSNDKQTEKASRNRNKYEYRHRNNYEDGNNYQQRDNYEQRNIYQRSNYENRNKYRPRSKPEEVSNYYKNSNYRSRNSYEQKNNYKQRNNKQCKGKNEPKEISNGDGSNTVKGESLETEHDDQKQDKITSSSDVIVTYDGTSKSTMENANLNDCKGTVPNEIEDVDTTKNSVIKDIVLEETIDLDTVTKEIVSMDTVAKDTVAKDTEQQKIKLKGNHHPKRQPRDEKGEQEFRENRNKDFKSSNDITCKNDNSKRDRRRDNKPRNQNTSTRRTKDHISDTKCSDDSSDILSTNVSSGNSKSSDIRVPPGFEKDIAKDMYPCGDLLLEDSLKPCIKSDANSSSICSIPPGFEKVERRDTENTEFFLHKNDTQNLTAELNKFVDLTHATTVPPGFTENTRINIKETKNSVHEKNTFRGQKIPPGFHKIEKKEFRGPGHSANYKGSLNTSGKTSYGKVCSRSNNHMKIDQPEHNVKTKHTRKQNPKSKLSDDTVDSL